MTTNQTIDGVLVSRELLRRVSDPYRPRGQENARQELRALLDAPVNPLSEIEVLRAAVKELEAMRDARVYAKLAQGEPVAWRNIATGHVTTSAVVVMDWDDEKEQVQSLYAEQPAPVAVVLPERREPKHYWDRFGKLTAIASVAAEEWNACLDELKRLNPSL